MPKTEKILMMFFLILFLIIVGEIGYYFFSKAQLSKPIKTVQNMPSPTIITPTITSSNQTAIEPAIADETIDNLKKINKGILISSIVTNQYQGEIVELDTKGGITTKNFSYRVKIRIKGENNTFNNFYYNEADLAHTKFLKKSDDINIPINITDLKVGDLINIKVTTDLMKGLDDNTIEIEILKL